MLTRLLAATLVVTLAALFAPKVRAADDQPVPALVDVVVDGIAHGRIVAEIASDDVLVRASDAEALGLPASVAGNDTTERSTWRSLRACAGTLAYRFDPHTLVLTIQVAAAALGTRTIAVAQSGPPSDLVVARPPSAFVNYFVAAGSTGAPTAAFESGFSANGRLAYSSAALVPGSGLVRGQSYLAFDDPQAMRRDTIGDSLVGGDALVGEVDLLGAGRARSFALDPYLYRFPSPQIAGTIATPGSADVYVNGTLAQSVPLAPGGYDLTNLPISTG
ncbi:MAG: hypothetical protein ACREM2_06455, partial [Vulcanimicrobiaceae bacterium]